MKGGQLFWLELVLSSSHAQLVKRLLFDLCPHSGLGCAQLFAILSLNAAIAAALGGS